MKFILNHFQIVIHTLDTSLGFFEHISKDLGLEEINIGLPFGSSFISSKWNVNRQPIVNSCLGGWELKFSWYKRYACPNCSMRFVIENTDKDLIKLNKSLRLNLRKVYQTTVINLFTQEQILGMLNSNADPDF